ncbi:hypothetical protein EDD15DRAFT_2490324 [Pisolithus albus]|nr:hypothetical protein EDD15DRAFT_2490324 [Pisolithus albus]
MPTVGTPPGTARTKTPVLRNNTRSTSHANLKDPLATQTSTVTDQASGLRYLQKRELLPVGDPPSLRNLTTALHFIAQLPHVPASAIDGIKAVAFLLDHVKTASHEAELQNSVLPSLSETVANHVIASISPHIASLQDSATKLQHGNPHPPQQPLPNGSSEQIIAALLPDIASTRNSIKQLEGKLNILDTLHQHLATNGTVGSCADTTTLERIETAVDSVNLCLTDVNMSIDILVPSLTATQSQVNALHKYMTSQNPATPQGPVTSLPARSYSDVAKTPPQSRLAAAALAKAETRSRQVLFTPSATQTLYSKNTDPASIAADIMDLLITLVDENSPHANIKSAVCLNNGNLLLELNSEEAAHWIRSAHVRETLSTKLGTLAPLTQAPNVTGKQRKPRQMTVLGPKARQSTLDSFARKPDTLTVIRSSSSSLPPNILEYSPPCDPHAFDDPPPAPPLPVTATGQAPTTAHA